MHTAIDLTQSEALRLIVEGTSRATGAEFFPTLVRSLATTLGYKYAMVAVVEDESLQRVRTLAVWAGADHADNFDYELKGTPCDNVVNRRVCFYPQDVQLLFPEDELLVEMGVHSYMGTPLLSVAEQPLGLIAVMDDEPVDEHQDARPILAIFADRAAAELDRCRAEEQREDLIRKLEAKNAELEAFKKRHDS